MDFYFLRIVVIALITPFFARQAVAMEAKRRHTQAKDYVLD